MALAALRKLVARGVIKRDERVVVLSTAHGLKFIDFKVRYHRRALDELDAPLANDEIVLPADYGRVRDTIFREIERRFGSGADRRTGE